MHDATDLGKGAVHLQVGGLVGGGAQTALCHLARHIHYHHVLSLHDVIGNPAGLDDHQAGGRVPRADIAPGVLHQALPGQLQVGGKHPFF